MERPRVEGRVVDVLRAVCCVLRERLKRAHCPNWLVLRNTQQATRSVLLVTFEISLLLWGYVTKGRLRLFARL